jgi:hypothetical protein
MSCSAGRAWALRVGIIKPASAVEQRRTFPIRLRTLDEDCFGAAYAGLDCIQTAGEAQLPQAVPRVPILIFDIFFSQSAQKLLFCRLKGKDINV